MNKPEIEKIQQAIQALEAQRQSLGDEVVETALQPLRSRLASLESSGLYEQRKLATVLFADLVGFTALSAQLDPEDMRELLNAYFDRCRLIIEQHGGVIEKFIGDAVMAVFGLQVSREDDPERAVHAGLELSEMVGQVEVDPAFGQAQVLAARVGITTGEVVVGALGERQEGDFVVVGEAVNLASRLQSAAPAGEVLITHDTYRHVRGVFDVQPVELLHLKGIAGPVPAYLVKAARPRTFRLARRGVEGVETPLIGREFELNQLKEAFNQVLQSGRQQVVTVLGEAGIGKSRLIAEFEDWLEQLPQVVYSFKGRAHPSMQTAPYSLIRDMFAFRFQIQDSDPPPTVRQKLEQGYAQAFLSRAAGEEGQAGKNSKERAAHFLGRLLGFEYGLSEHVLAAEQDARVLHDQAFVYLKDYLRALAGKNPVVVLLEELHWADDSSLDLIQILESSMSNQQVLVIGATRPNFFERRPQWNESPPSYHLIRLEPLSTQDSRALVERILHKVENLPGSLSDLVVATAEGNPFYIEELLKMLIEDGVIRTHEAGWQVEGERLAEIRVPPTLTGVLQARFDSLPAQERAYLQRGSVIGRVFWDRAVEYMGDPEDTAGNHANPLPPELPDRLQTREMIFKRERSTFEDTCEYLFKHALLRDVTYESLLKRQRRFFHHQAARWLEQVTERSGRRDEFAALIAAHYEQAGERDPAAAWYWQAGRWAASRYANTEALHAFDRALELIPQEDLDRQFEIRMSREKVYELLGIREKQIQELETLHVLAERLADPARQALAALRRAAYDFSISNYPAAIASAQRAGSLAQAGQEREIVAEIDLLQANALIRQGSLEEAGEYARRSLDLARQQDMYRVQANSLRVLGLIAYFMGSHREAHDQFTAALDLYVKIGDRQGESMALNNLGGANFEMGDHRQARDYYARSLELCREIGDRVGEGRALNNLGITSVVQADYDRAEEFYLQALQITREVGHRTAEMGALDNLGNLALYRYRFSQARNYQLDALRGAREIGDRVTESFALLNLGRGCLMMGDYESADQFIREALEVVREVGDQQGECDLRISLSQYYCQTGDAEAARLQAQQALEQAEKHELNSELSSALQRLGEADLVLGQAQAAYEHFLAAVEIRREQNEAEVCDSLAGLARACLSLGDLAQALVQVEQLLEYWQAHGILGLEDPIMDMLTCYQVLTAANDPRAPGLLEQGYHLLQECAANIEDEDQRRLFLQNVSSNRELAEIWNARGR